MGMSATATDRASDLHMLCEDKSVRAIFPSVGGSFASQLLPCLDYDLILRTGKLIFSFSDSGIVGLAITVKTGLVTYYCGLDVVNMSDTSRQASIDRIISVLNHKPLPDVPMQVLHEGEAHGTLYGGTASTIESVIGTEWEPNWDNSILFIETGEDVYAIYRTLMHLINMGLFRDRIKGLIVGDCRKLSGNDTSPAEEMIQELFSGIVLPIYFNAPVGHDIETYVMPVGAEVAMKGGKLLI